MKIGVVIPTLDEAGAIEAALRSLGAAGPGDGAELAASLVEVEVVVADGGSRDDTCARARMAGARVIDLPRDPTQGRARQLQAGFTACAGDAVLFLHADTRLPEGWALAVKRALADPSIVGGAFRFRFDPQEGVSPLLRLIEWGARLRAALFALPYGDQALFVRRPALEKMGGVPQAPFMEDLDLVRAMKRHGRIARLPEPATTSSRRYREAGVLRTFARNLVSLLAWRLGLDRARVAAWYRR